MIEMHTQYEGTSEKETGPRKESNQNQKTGERDRGIGKSISDQGRGIYKDVRRERV